MKYETTILITNFNGAAHLKKCLTSLLQQTYQNFKIILIDNNSQDKSVEYVKRNFPEVDILQCDKNNGNAKANNIGIKYSIKKYNPKYIAILNNDTKSDQDWLYYLIRAIESEDKISAVASHMLYYDNPQIINSQGCTANIIGDGYDINIFKKRKDIKEFQKRVLYPSAGAMLLKTNFLDKIGIFDERYFIYSEELDWGLRANLYGYKITFEEKAIVYHKGSSTFTNNQLKKEYLCKRNALCTIIKNYELKTLIKVAILLFWNYLTYPLWALKNKGPKYILIPLKSLLWNIKSIIETLKLRKSVQSNREIKDSEIFKLMV